jgi:Holliday junction resolvase RusA-like endonuclease
MARPIISIDFPPPPSTNQMYGKGRGRVFLSDRYRKWIKVSCQEVMAAGVMRGVQTITGPFKAIITVDKNLSRADCDNLIKPVLDLAEKRLKIISNDKNATSVGVGWGTAPLGCRLTIIPVEDKDASE